MFMFIFGLMWLGLVIGFSSLWMCWLNEVFWWCICLNCVVLIVVLLFGLVMLSMCLFWLIMVICFGVRFGMLVVIMCMMVLIWLCFSCWLFCSFRVIEVLVMLCWWVKVLGLGMVRCMCELCIGCNVLMVCDSLVFSVCW